MNRGEVVVHTEEYGTVKIYKMPEWLWHLMVKFYSTDSGIRPEGCKPTFDNFVLYMNANKYLLPVKCKDIRQLITSPIFITYSVLLNRGINIMVCLN